MKFAIKPETQQPTPVIQQTEHDRQSDFKMALVILVVFCMFAYGAHYLAEQIVTFNQQIEQSLK